MKKIIAAMIAVCCFSMPAFSATPPDPDPSLPASKDFLPQPPGQGSIDFLRDKEIYEMTRAERGTPRWTQAIEDADYANMSLRFEKSFGLRITEKDMPETYALLYIANRAQLTSINTAKKQYQRQRPYAHFKATGETCAPAEEETLRTNGSYPSGHAARGWTTALILAELAPERQIEILRRGYEIGQSRVICGYHWQSDVEMGRQTATIVVNYLHSRKDFVDQMAKAKQEIASLRKK